jgi:hypothetical protein
MWFIPTPNTIEAKRTKVVQKFREIEAKTEQNCPKLHKIEWRMKIIIPKSRINRNRLYLPKIEAKAYLIDLPKLLACVRGVLGNKCAGHHNLKTVQMREIMFK